MTKQEIEKEIKKICADKGWTYAQAKKHLMSEMYVAFSATTPEAPPETGGKMYALKSLPIFKVGIHHDVPYSLDDLDEIVKNTNILINTKLLDPPMKLGHDLDQKLVQKDGYPAVGWTQQLERIGDQIFADIDNIPEKVYTCIEKKAYKHISPEIAVNYPHPSTKENMGLVLVGIALLGADIPEIKGLGDILSLFGAKAQVQKFSFVEFSANDLKEAKEMKGNWKVKQAIETYGCCGAEFRKFAEDNKTNEIPGDKVAEIVAKKSTKKMEDAGADNIECPDGFSWDEAAGRCMPSQNDKEKVKGEEQKVCPKGWAWDDATGKCIKSSVEDNAAKPKMDAKKIVMAMLKARGKKIDETKDLDEQMPDDKEISDMIASMKAPAEPADKKPEEWSDDDKLNMKLKHEKDPDPKKDEMTDGQAAPAEWLDACKAKMGGDNADKVCAHIWAKQMAPESKTKAVKPPEDVQKAAEVKQMNEQIRGLTIKKFTETVSALKTKHRGVLVPALDSAIDTLTEHIARNESVIKFSSDGKPNQSFAEMWVEFLADIAKRKTLIFGEMAKANETAKGNTEIITMSETEKKEDTKIFSEIAHGTEVSNIEFAASARAYATQNKISIKKAQQELGKIARAKAGK